MNANEILKSAKLIYKEAYKLAKPCKWFDIDGDCKITFITGYKNIWIPLCCGLREKLIMQERGILEKDKIRSNTKTYYKLFYQNGKLLKVEAYNEGRICAYYLCYYVDNKRVLQSFDNITHKPTFHYCIVTWFSDLGVEQEAWIDEKGYQVLFSQYTFKDGFIEFRQANCLPHTIHKEDHINCYCSGIFRDVGTGYEFLELQ